MSWISPPLPARLLLSATRGRALSPEHREYELKRFMESIKLPNGSFRTTYPGRLDELNFAVMEHLESLPRPLSILDVGISSGVSTLEWTRSLKEAGVEHEMRGVDLMIKARLVSVGGWMDILVDREGRALQYALGDTGVRPWLRRLDALTGYWIVVLSMRGLHGLVRCVHDPGNGAAGSGPPPWIRTEEIDLVLPEVAGGGIRVEEMDVLQAPPASARGTESIIRVANILNRVSFPEAGIRRALLNLSELLRSGGLLIVSRTDPSTHLSHGGIYRRDSSCYTRLSTVGDGSEIDGVVRALDLPPS